MSFTYKHDGREESHPRAHFRDLFLLPWQQRQLIVALTRRDILSRYRGSVMGLAWSIVQPLIMLAMYTVVFGTLLRSRWPGTDNSFQFAVILFVGLILFNFFAECLNRAPTIITTNANYVTKVVFPLEILPWITVASAAFHFLTSFAVWVVFALCVYGKLQWTIVFLPALFMPLAFVGVGVGWLFAATGVYVRDLTYVTTLLSSLLMFLSPVFYALDTLTPAFRALILLNPLTFIIEQARAVMIAGALPDFGGIAIYLSCSIGFAWICLAWFQKTREGFADVV
ncbi:lipopolysaccharide transport system permease protein [Paraburkholderia sp. BL27I4N3]|uniref:ABC transporter permease n=1 Tax=Paraburkholderia sp. BL27I4N3 TaxID=1938805 RepID=UPI000E249EFA|nr:ABC transporter permease [Paraburkholderia sp. BL27I4N3]REE22551.1 lipopolysaccharide transport system permease protein [Paraburkholderia sp. BL27I4N3]